VERQSRLATGTRGFRGQKGSARYLRGWVRGRRGVCDFDGALVGVSGRPRPGYRSVPAGVGLFLRGILRQGMLSMGSKPPDGGDRMESGRMAKHWEVGGSVSFTSGRAIEVGVELEA